MKVTVVLRDGGVITGTSARGMDVAYAPQATRDLFLRDAVGANDAGEEVLRSEVGAFVAGSEIVTVFFEPVAAQAGVDTSTNAES